LRSPFISSIVRSRTPDPILFLFVHNEKNQPPISIHLRTPSGLMNLIRDGDRRKLQFAVAVSYFCFFRLLLSTVCPLGAAVLMTCFSITRTGDDKNLHLWGADTYHVRRLRLFRIYFFRDVGKCSKLLDAEHRKIQVFWIV
jgi:hypothetical protein